MTPEATGPESLRAPDSLAMALGRIEVDMGRFKAGQGIGRPYAHCDADLATIKAALLPPTVHAGWLETATDYIRRYGGRCRDCADQNGACAGSGLPCDIPAANKAIEHVLKALIYGLEHKYLSPGLLAIARSGSGGTGQ